MSSNYRRYGLKNASKEAPLQHGDMPAFSAGSGKFMRAVTWPSHAVLTIKLVHASGRIEDFLLARIKRMAQRAHLNVQIARIR